MQTLSFNAFPLQSVESGKDKNITYCLAARGTREAG